MNVKIFLKFFLIFFQIHKIFNSLVFPFEKISNFKNYTLNLINNNIYSNITLGSPSQKIPVYFTFESNFFIIKNKSIGGIFNEKLSKTLSKNLDLDFNCKFEGIFYNGYYKNDNFLINNYKDEKIKINNLIFGLSNYYTIINSNKTNENYKNLSIIGLKLDNERGVINEKNFIKQLKDKGILETYSFTFVYDSNNKGILYLGCCINNFDEDYHLSDYRYTKVNIDRKYFEWKIKFDRVNYSNNFSESIFKEAIFNINLGGIIGNFKYKEYIYETIFNKYFKEKICLEEKIFDEYVAIYCDNKNFNIKKFPKIEFYHKKMNYSFIFDFNDLFTENENKIYFNVFFNEKFNNFQWIFGEIFLRKYQIVFNQEQKLIGFYVNKKKRKKINYHLFLNICFISIILVLIVFIINIKNKIPRKIKANELEENINYYSINNKNNKYLI